MMAVVHTELKTMKEKKKEKKTFTNQCLWSIISYQQNLMSLNDLYDSVIKRHTPWGSSLLYNYVSNSMTIRFTHIEIHHTVDLFDLEIIEWHFRYSSSLNVALAIVLWHLFYSHWYINMLLWFEQFSAWLSLMFNDVIIHLVKCYRTKLFWDSIYLIYNSLSTVSWPYWKSWRKLKCMRLYWWNLTSKHSISEESRNIL